MEILNTFIKQTYNDLNRLDRNLALLKSPHSRDDAIQGLYKIIHIIHGTGGLYGLKGIEEISAPVEKILKELRSNKNSENYDVESLITRYKISLQSILTSLADTGEEDSDTIESFKSSIDSPKAESKAVGSSINKESTPLEKDVENKIQSHDWKPSLDVSALLRSIADLSCEITFAQSELGRFQTQIKEQEFNKTVARIGNLSNSLLKKIYKAKVEPISFWVEQCLILTHQNLQISIPFPYINGIIRFQNYSKVQEELQNNGNGHFTYLEESFPWVSLEEILELEKGKEDWEFTGIILTHKEKKLGILTHFQPDSDILAIRSGNSIIKSIPVYNGVSTRHGKPILNWNIPFIVDKYGKPSVVTHKKPPAQPVILSEDVLLVKESAGKYMGISIKLIEKIDKIEDKDKFNEITNGFKVLDLAGIKESFEFSGKYIIWLKLKEPKVGVLSDNVQEIYSGNWEKLSTSENLYSNVKIVGKAKTKFGEIPVIDSV